jgi:hypothetical protein
MTWRGGDSRTTTRRGGETRRTTWRGATTERVARESLTRAGFEPAYARRVAESAVPGRTRTEAREAAAFVARAA